MEKIYRVNDLKKEIIVYVIFDGYYVPERTTKGKMYWLNAGIFLQVQGESQFDEMGLPRVISADQDQTKSLFLLIYQELRHILNARGVKETLPAIVHCIRKCNFEMIQSHLSYY